MLIRSLLEADWPSVSEIYKEGIATGLATFEKEVPDWKEWNANHLQSCRIVAESNDTITGWAALTPVSGRCVYAGVAEVSVYVAHNFRGQGIGLKLLNELIRLSETEGIWSLQSGIFPENKPSIELHKKAGFRIVGYREKIGKLHGTWMDNCILERRSTVVGTD